MVGCFSKIAVKFPLKASLATAFTFILISIGVCLEWYNWIVGLIILVSIIVSGLAGDYIMEKLKNN